ncbi:hypothetical protein HanIR_Chr01g0030871 [Helianthus annuus]|nr:hypothetical protein HanIR_Chr01g0030871 [Helianthus annuus]
MRRSLKILSRLMLILSKLIRVLFFILFLSNTAPILERPEGSLADGGAVNVIEKKLKQRARRAVAKIVAERQGMIGGCASEVKPERCLDGIDFRCKIVDLGVNRLRKKFKRDSIEPLKLYYNLGTRSRLICGHLLAPLLNSLLVK